MFAYVYESMCEAYRQREKRKKRVREREREKSLRREMKKKAKIWKSWDLDI